MDDGDSTYIAASDAANANMSCQGYPNLLSAGESLLESVMDTFEDAVEDQKWFRFLKAKYDSFNHLEEDGTVTLMTMLSDEDMTLNTYQTLQTYDNFTAAIPNNEPEDGKDNETVLSDEVDEADLMPTPTSRKLEQLRVQCPMEADIDYFEVVNDTLEKVHEDSEQEDHEEEDEKAGDDACEEDKKKGDLKEDYRIQSDFDGNEGNAEELGEECEAERALVAMEEEDNSLCLSQVELSQDGSIIAEAAGTKTGSSMQSVRSAVNKKAAESSVCSALSFPSLGEPAGYPKDEIESSPSSSGLEMNFVPYALPAFSFHSRQASKESKATQDSRHTINTAELSNGSHKSERNNHEAHASVEVIGMKRKKRFGCLRFWNQKPSKAIASKNEKPLPKKIEAPKTATKPKTPVLRRPVKEKKLPKTTVIVTRN
jgi:hypothetical protein